MNRIVMLCGGVLAAGFFCGGLRVHAAGQDAPALYSAAQAKRGSGLYQTQMCGVCHGETLGGADQAPPLAGAEFVAKYADQSILVLFDKVQKTMPATKPGSLTPAQTSDLLTFILSSNKYAAGDAELPADRDQLKAIQMPKPTK